MYYIIQDPPVLGNRGKGVPEAFYAGMKKHGETTLIRGYDSPPDTPLIQAWEKHNFDVIQELSYRKLKSSDTLVFSEWCHFGLDGLLFDLAKRGIKPKLAGFLRGASFLPGDMFEGNDRIFRYEVYLSNIYDRVLVQSQWVADCWPKASMRTMPMVVGSPFDFDRFRQFRRPWKERRYDVLLCTRWDADKGGDEMEQFCRELDGRLNVLVCTPAALPERIAKIPGVTVKTGLICESLWQEMGDSRSVFSAAHQETWGYAVMEAVACGCVPIVPNRAVYPELYKSESVYASAPDAAAMAAVIAENTANGWDGPHSPQDAFLCVPQFHGPGVVADT